MRIHQTFYKRRFIMPLLMVPALVAVSLGGQSLGSISGTLAGDDGTPLAAMITVNGIPPLRSSGSTKSATNGGFMISNLTPGTYHICAETGGAGYLDPCAWEPIPMVVQIAAAQAISGYQLTAKKGVPLQVRINDPAELLTSAVPLAAGQTAPSLLIGVFTTRGLFQPLFTASADSGGTNRQVTVPQNFQVRLHVSGHGIQITNASGAAVSATGMLSTVNASGTITFTVSASAVSANP